LDISSQVFTLIGVVSGGAVTYFATAMTERTQWKRAFSARWDAQRLEAYKEYTLSVRKMVAIMNGMAVDKGLLDGPVPIDSQAGRPDLGEVDRRRAESFETVLLLGDEDAIEAGHKLHATIWQLSDYILGNKEVDREKWECAYERYRVARSNFYRSARVSLEIEFPERR
jgi:hypothetical protein